jgi:hypothetical protein
MAVQSPSIVRSAALRRSPLLLQDAQSFARGNHQPGNQSRLVEITFLA